MKPRFINLLHFPSLSPSPPLPPPPSLLSHPPSNAPTVRTKTTGKVTFDWQAPANTGGLKLKQYRVHRSERCFGFNQVADVNVDIGTGRNFTIQPSDSPKNGKHGPISNVANQPGWSGIQKWAAYVGDPMTSTPMTKIDPSSASKKITIAQINTHPGMLQSKVTSEHTGSDLFQLMSPSMAIKKDIPHVLTIRGVTASASAAANIFVYDPNGVNSGVKVHDGPSLADGSIRDHVMRVTFTSDTVVRVGVRWTATPSINDAIELDVVCFHPSHYVFGDDSMASPVSADSIPDNFLELDIVSADVTTYTDAGVRIPSRCVDKLWCSSIHSPHAFNCSDLLVHSPPHPL